MYGVPDRHVPARFAVSLFSVKPVSLTSTQITKSASGEGDGTQKSSDTMAMKHRMDKAVYVTIINGF